MSSYHTLCSGPQLVRARHSLGGKTLAARVRWIGRAAKERTAHLSQVVDNRRFLVLPWPQIKGLAPNFLAGVAHRLPTDWALGALRNVHSTRRNAGTAPLACLS